MTQLSLSLTLPEIFSADNFFVSACNEAAYNTVLQPQNWTSHALYLHGDADSGKSHLAYIWAQKNNAVIIPANGISPENIHGNCVVEDIEKCTDERSLFHLFNHCKDIGTKLLITSNTPPSSLPFTLPDLTSRLRGCQFTSLDAPDDELIAAALRKQFSDRQLLVDEEIISYITARTERSMETIKELVEKIDNAAMSQSRNITIPFVKKILDHPAEHEATSIIL